MNWLIVFVIVALLYYYFVFVKAGDFKFWKVAAAHPEEAYRFLKDNKCFLLFDGKPPDGYRENLPSGNWDGPFRLSIPSKNRIITIYGRSPQYLFAQKKFLRMFHA